MSIECSYTRPFVCNWSGEHRPTASKMALMQATAPDFGNWAAFAIHAAHYDGYCFGYGQAFMNGYFDERGRPQGVGLFGDYSNPITLTNGLYVQLKNAIASVSKVARGSRVLLINDRPDNYGIADLGGQSRSWGQLVKALSAGDQIVPTTFAALQNGAYQYDNSIAFFENFKCIVLLLQGDAWRPSNEILAHLSNAILRGAPVVCLQADGYNASANATFNAIFNPLNVRVSGVGYAHLYAEAVSDYKNVYGDDLLWTSIGYMHNSTLFIAGCAVYNWVDANAQSVTFSSRFGSWKKGGCADVIINTDTYIANAVVFKPNCCYGEGETYDIAFDVPSTVLKPDDYAVLLQQGILHFDWWHELQLPEHAAEVIQVWARGYSSAPVGQITPDAIRYRGNSWNAVRSYNVLTIDRVSGNPVDYRSFDVYGDLSQTEAAACAAFLNAQGSDKIVVVVTSDEPMRFLTPQLINALARCGASVATLRRLKMRGAYMLVGVPGHPVGIERWADAPADSPNASVRASFDLRPDGVRPLDVRMTDLHGRALLATIQGIAERVVFQANWDAYQNQKALDDPATAVFNARFVKNVLNWIRRGVGSEVLFVPTMLATTGDWMPLNTAPNGCASFLDYVRAAGYNVSVLDHTKISNPAASAYAKYDVVIYWAAGGGSDDMARMSILMPVLATLVKGGAGLFAISDTAHPNMNQLASTYSVQTNFVAGIQPESFDVERAKSLHGEHAIFEGLVGRFNNDSAAGGYLTQTRVLWPYCVDGENLNYVELKENGRIARLHYVKPMDGMDNRRVFSLDAWAKMTDLRFKKLDMSDTDKWPLAIELPCVIIDDNPRISINDIEVEEGDSGHTPATFTVTLEAPLRGRPLIVPWRVIDGTATSVPGDTSKFPKGLMVDVDGNWASVYLKYDNVRIVADGGFPKFYNNSMVTGSWQRQYMKNVLDFMQRGRGKRKVLFLGDQPDLNANYATLGSDPSDFGIAVPQAIQAAGYTVESWTWQNFKGGRPSVADFLEFDSIVFICSTTSQASAINLTYTNTLETAIRQGVGLFAITDHDVFTKSFVPLMARFSIRIYNDASEQSAVDFAQCRAQLESPELLANINVPGYTSPGSISAFIYDPAVASPPDIDPPFSGELVFDSNDVSKQITINVVGEKLVEDDEFFYVELFDPTRGELVKARGRCVILNDDGDLFNTRQLEKVVSWSGYIAGGDWPATPGVDLFMFAVPSSWGHQQRECSVWLTQDGTNIVQADRSGWSATYKFNVGRQASCNIYIMDDDSSNTKIYNSAGTLVFEWGSGGNASTYEQALLLPADEYTVVCQVHNDANGNDYGGNPGYLGISIRRA